MQIQEFRATHIDISQHGYYFFHSSCLFLFSISWNLIMWVLTAIQSMQLCKLPTYSPSESFIQNNLDLACCLGDWIYHHLSSVRLSSICTTNFWGSAPFIFALFWQRFFTTTTPDLRPVRIILRSYSNKSAAVSMQTQEKKMRDHS